MKLECSRETLLEAVSSAGSVAISSFQKINSCLMLTLGDEGLEIIGTDLELSVSSMIIRDAMEGSEPGVCAVPSGELESILKSETAEVMKLEYEKERMTLLVQGDSEFSLQCMDPLAFPIVPGFRNEPEYTDFPANDLRDGIERVKFAVCREPSRYAISGICLKPNESKKGTCFVAMDGKSFAIWGAKVKPPVDGPVLLSLKFCELLEKNLPAGDDEIIGLRFMDGLSIAKCGNTIISGRLVEGQFPDYADLLKGMGSATKALVVKREKLLSALAQALILTDKEHFSAVLRIPEGTLENTLPERGQSTIKILEAKCEGKFVIAFNPSRFRDIVKASTLDEVVLEIIDPKRPFIVREGNNWIAAFAGIEVKGGGGK